MTRLAKLIATARQRMAQFVAGDAFVVNPAPRVGPKFSRDTVEQSIAGRASRRAKIATPYIETNRKLAAEVFGEGE